MYGTIRTNHPLRSILFSLHKYHHPFSRTSHSKDMAQSTSTRSCDAHQNGSASGSSSLFLSLPAELRVEIYRHLLVSSGPIVLPSDSIGSLRSCDDKPSSLALLRTCTQIRNEATNVLYGENQFRFMSEWMACSILHYLPRSGFHHLKELTMPTPFRGYICYPRHRYRQQRSSNIFDYDSQPRPINPSLCRTDYQPNHAINQIFNAIANAPHLQQLNLLLDKRREYETNWSCPLSGSYHRFYYKFVNNEDVWQDLAGLLRVKRTLRIAIVLHGYPEQPLFKNAKRFLGAMRSRLGVWDVREMYRYNGCYGWNDFPTLPAANEEDNPEEWLLAVRNLFEE